MAKALFVTGTDTEVGKTLVTAGMLVALKKQGKTTAAIKPVAAGAEPAPDGLRNEDGLLVGFVFVDVDDDIGIADYVEQARQVVNDRVSVPPGYRIAWAGQ